MTSELYGVSVYGDCGEDHGAWCIEVIADTLEKARHHAKWIAANERRDFPLVAPKIVRPSRETIELYLAAGNVIR